MERERFQKIIESIGKLGFQGVVLANTHRVEWPEAGGLSGHPLAVRSTKCLEWAHVVHRGELPVIASGGILSGLDVFERIARGAHAVQVYTALVYRGPWAVVELIVELQAAMQQRGFATLDEVRGSFYLDN
jgi:dihydroorotate dehydrogenase